MIRHLTLRTAIALGLSLLAQPALSQTDELVKRLLDLQLKKGIITQQEYDEFMAFATPAAQPSPPAAAPGAAAQAVEKADAHSAPAPASSTLAKSPSASSTAEPSKTGLALISSDSLKVELFGTVDISLGYTSKSLVPSGEMPTSIGPWLAGGVRYPATNNYPASNMSSQMGLFNSSLSTSSWGLRASRELGGGKKAFILLDSAFNPITGQIIDQAHNEASNSKYPTTVYGTSSLNGQLFNKEAYIGVSDTEHGRITFGRNNNFILDVMSRYAPIQRAGLFIPYGNGIYGGGGGISEHGRIDNSVKYTHKIGNVNVGLMQGFGGSGGLKHGAQGTAGLIGYEDSRYGIQLVYQEFKDLLKTSIDTTTANTINLTAHDQQALLLMGKYSINRSTRLQTGLQRATLTTPSADPNIPFINSIYGETVNKSSAYSGDPIRINTYHLGIDHDLSEKLYIGAAYTYIDLPKYSYLSGSTVANYLGGSVDAISGLAVYKLYTSTDLYGGIVITNYSGGAFRDSASYHYARNIFTAATGLRFRF